LPVMPQIPTKYFGPVEYQETDVVQFPCGLPGFESETQFLLIEPENSAPLIFLQSMRQSGLCFLTLPILTVDPRYHLSVNVDDLRLLEFHSEQAPQIGVDINCLTVIAVAESGAATANLLAPLVINRSNRLALQAIRIDTVYSHQHPLGGPCS